MTAAIVDRLDPESLAPGELTNLQIQIAHDSLGRPIRLPVIAVRGAKPGPVIGITAALHGNELNGIPVVQRLLRDLDPARLSGTVVGVVVMNPPGYIANERTFESTWDLNHAFPGRADGNSAELYVHRLIERVVRPFDRLIDLHTASFGRVNSLYIRADMTAEATARMAYLMRPEIIVHNPPNDRTLRGHAENLGIPAITVEVGNPQRYQRGYITRSVRGVRAILAADGALRARPRAPLPDPILCASSEWLYTKEGGLLEVFPAVCERIAAGEPLAEVRDPWGDLSASHAAPYDAVIVGRSVNPAAPSGARIAHLGREAAPGDERFVSLASVDPVLAEEDA